LNGNTDGYGLAFIFDICYNILHFASNSHFLNLIYKNNPLMLDLGLLPATQYKIVQDSQVI